jgi:zinc protease
MKRIALALAFAMMMTFTSVAQEKPKVEAPKTDAKAEALPSVDDILDKYVKAIGGKEAIEKIKSRSMKGSFNIEAMNMTGAVEMFTKAPNKSAMKIDLPNFGVVNRVFDGAKGWDLNPMSGLREVSGAELAQMKRSSDFHQEINFKKHYAKMEVKGKEKVGSYETYVIEATPPEGSVVKLFFDVSTGLLVRQDGESETPDGKIPIETYIDEYKAVDGVKVAHTLKQVNPMMTWAITISEVKSNVEIDEAKFNKPSN